MATIGSAGSDASAHSLDDGEKQCTRRTCEEEDERAGERALVDPDDVGDRLACDRLARFLLSPVPDESWVMGLGYESGEERGERAEDGDDAQVPAARVEKVDEVRAALSSGSCAEAHR